METIVATERSPTIRCAAPVSNRIEFTLYDADIVKDAVQVGEGE
jgi:hypothetical protein